VSLEALASLFPEECIGPLQITSGGLWQPTPLAVLAAALPLVEGLLCSGAPGRRVIFDAGAGDGRVLAALALGLSPRLDVTLVGLECAPPLARAARATMGALPLPAHRRPRVEEGSYLEPRDYARLGIDTKALDLVFNYPDGNEARLLRFLDAEAGPATRLLVLSPDRYPALGRDPERRETVPSANGAAWSLSVFTVC
jgi:hypothetical protein